VTSKTFYRVHNDTCPCLCAEHAYSAPAGVTFIDCATYICPTCHACAIEGCATCGEHGTIPATRGYSCFESLDAAQAYLEKAGAWRTAIYRFEGEHVGTGLDGEPLAIPTGDAVRLSE
jgi:hypothetical protein